MPEEVSTPDLVELVRRQFESVSRRDFDAVMSFYAPGAVWEAIGMGTRFEGADAIRDLYEDWIGAYERYEIEAEEVVDVGNGVVFAVNLQRGRPVGSTRDVRLRQGTISVWVHGVIVRSANYGDVEEARAAAGRLAESRR
jgi:ketosteroid isomerase-like protein